MSTSTITAPPRQAADTSMTAKQAAEVRDRLRDEGWTPVESSTDFRLTVVGADHVGTERTIAYFPEFRKLLGGAMGWSIKGRVEVPDEAAFTEVYAVIESNDKGRWAPAD